MALRRIDTAILGLLLAGNTTAFAAAHDAPAVPCVPPAAVPPHVHVLDCSLAKRLAAGLERSATLRRLVQRIGESNGVVVVTGARPVWRTHAFTGGVSLRVATAGSVRVLQVMVVPYPGDRTIGTLAAYTAHDRICRSLLIRNQFVHSCVLLRKRALDRAGW